MGKITLPLAALLMFNACFIANLTIPLAFSLEGFIYVFVSQLIVLAAYREGKRK